VANRDAAVLAYSSAVRLCLLAVAVSAAAPLSAAPLALAEA